VNLKINKAYRQGETVIRIVVPHEAVPNDMLDEYHSEMDKVKKFRDSLSDDANKRAETSKYKEENNIKELYSFWNIIGTNLTILSFRLTDNESKLYSKTEQLKVGSDVLNDAVTKLRQFGLKEINLMPLSEGKGDVPSEDLTELKEDLNYWKDISSILLNLFNKATEDPKGMEVIKPFLSDNGKPTEEYSQIINALEKIGGE
jgi:hypothetical protein